MTTAAPQMMTLQEAHDRTRVPLSTLRYWIAEGRLKAAKAGIKRLVRQDELLALIGMSPDGEIIYKPDPKKPKRVPSPRFKNKALQKRERLAAASPLNK